MAAFHEWINFALLFLSVSFNYISCSRYTALSSSDTDLVDIDIDTHIHTPARTNKFNFDAEQLYRELVNEGNPHEYKNEMIFTRCESIICSYGADRKPIERVPFNFDFNIEMAADLTSNCITLSSRILRHILDFMTLSELQGLANLGLTRAFTQSVLSVLNNKNPFPFMSLKGMKPLQLKNLPIAAELINRVYPALHVKAIERVEEIGIILAITFLKFHAGENLEDLYVADGEMFNSYSGLIAFLDLFKFMFTLIQCDRQMKRIFEESIILKRSKEKNNNNNNNNDTKKKCNEVDEDDILYVTSFAILFRLDVVDDDSFKVDKFTYSNHLLHLEFVHEIYNFYLKPECKNDNENMILSVSGCDSSRSVQSSDMMRMRIFFKRFFKNVNDLTESFIDAVINVTFRHCGNFTILREFLVNPVTLLALQKNPQIFSLPVDYFEKYCNSADGGFLALYLSSPCNPYHPSHSSHSNHQNHHIYYSDLLVRASLNQSCDSIFISLLNNENFILCSDDDFLLKIIENLNESRYEFKYRTIVLFWNSKRIYNLFRGMASREREIILDKIVSEGARCYFHILALSECNFNYLELESGSGSSGTDLSLSPELKLSHSLTKIIARLLAEDCFYDHFASENELFLWQFIVSKAFTSNPQFHSHYLLSALKYRKYCMFSLLLQSESISLWFEDFVAIIGGLSEYSLLSSCDKYSYAFWRESKAIRRLFFTSMSPDFTVYLIKHIIVSRHYTQLFHILEPSLGENENEKYSIRSDHFDFITFCLNSGVEPTMIKDFIRSPGFAVRFPNQPVASYIRLQLCFT